MRIALPPVSGTKNGPDGPFSTLTHAKGDVAARVRSVDAVRGAEARDFLAHLGCQLVGAHPTEDARQDLAFALVRGRMTGR